MTPEKQKKANDKKAAKKAAKLAKREAAQQKTTTKEDAAQQKAEADAARQAMKEAAARQKAEADAARQAAKQAAARQKAEADAVRQVAKEEAARQKAEADAVRQAAKEEAARQKAEADAARRAAKEEAARQKAEADAARRAAKEEAARQKAEADAAAKKQAALQEKAEAEAAQRAAADAAAREAAAATRKAQEEVSATPVASAAPASGPASTPTPAATPTPVASAAPASGPASTPTPAVAPAATPVASAGPASGPASTPTAAPTPVASAGPASGPASGPTPAAAPVAAAVPSDSAASGSVVVQDDGKDSKGKKSKSDKALAKAGGKNKKLSKKEKQEVAKPAHRTIRPVSSLGQRNTARLTWAVFGMALVIVAVLGFAVALSRANEEEPNRVEVLKSARSIQEGSFLAEEDLAVELVEIGGLNHILATQRPDILGRVALRTIQPDTPLTLGDFGGGPEAPPEPVEPEYTINVSHPTGAVVGEGIDSGSRVVILAVPVNMPHKRFAVEVVDVTSVGEAGGVNISTTFSGRAWWEEFLFQYSEEEDISFEFEEIDKIHDPLCWRERYRFINKVGELSRNDFLQLLAEKGCPEDWANTGLSPVTTIQIEGAPEPPPATGEVSERLEETRFTEVETQLPAALVDLLPKEEEAEGEGESG